MTSSVETHDARVQDVETTIKNALGFAHLATLWRVSKPGAWQWCSRYCTAEEMDALARNGHQGRLRWKFQDQEPSNVVEDRLRLLLAARVANWSVSRLARAMGIQPSSLHIWVRDNAPDGIEDALSDFREEDPNTAARAAA